MRNVGPHPLLGRVSSAAPRSAAAPQTSIDVLRMRGGNADLIFSTEAWELFFEHGIAFVNYFGGLLLLVAVSISLVNTLLFLINRITGMRFPMLVCFTDNAKRPVQLTRVRFQLGSMISMALMVMVAADILETLVKPAEKTSLTSLYKLGLVAVIRTGLAFFLHQEMKEVEEELEHFDGTKILV